MIYFTAHTINCVCHSMRTMFRVLGIYNFEPITKCIAHIISARLQIEIKRNNTLYQKYRRSLSLHYAIFGSGKKLPYPNLHCM